MFHTTTILGALFAHWMSDFVFQSHWMAMNKSKNWTALSAHVTIYSLCMTGALCAFLILPIPFVILPALIQNIVVPFFVITFVAHFLTDAITSRITAHLYAKDDTHNFFVVVGFDQVLHYTQLFLTIQWLVS